MAREPISLNRNTAPFTEASPPDDLQITTEIEKHALNGKKDIKMV